MTTKAKTTRRTTRTSKPAKPARRDRKPPGTRKAPASPAKPSGAASAPAAALDWNRITYEPIENKRIAAGMPVMLYTTGGDDRKLWEGVIDEAWIAWPYDSSEPEGRTYDIKITLRDGERVRIDRIREEDFRAWRGTFSK